MAITLFREIKSIKEQLEDMDLEIVLDLSEVDEKEWLMARKDGIGGSDASVVMGKNPYRNIIEIYQSKTEDRLIQIEENESMIEGRKIEKYITTRYKEKYLKEGYNIIKCPFLVRSKAFPFMQATIDRLIINENNKIVKGVEFKNPSEYQRKNWEEDVPEMYKPQCYHYSTVFGLNWEIVAFIGGRHWERYECTPTPEEQGELIQKERKFWKKVQKKEMPYIDFDVDEEMMSDDLLDSLWLENDYQEKLRRLEKIKEKTSELYKEKKNIEKEIKTLLQANDNDKAVCGNARIKLKDGHRFVASRAISILKENHPELQKEVKDIKDSGEADANWKEVKIEWEE